MIIKLDNFIPKKYQNDIENLATTLPYYYHTNTSYTPQDVVFNDWVSGNSKLPIIDNGQFSHGVYKDGNVLSEVYGLIYPILYIAAESAKIEVKEITRVKINLLIKDSSFEVYNYNCPHSDSGADFGFVYYINDSDGDTVFFDNFFVHGSIPTSLNVGDRVKPKKGSGVFFEARRYHASSNPSISQCRYVINYNFK